jgi:hypothetical protein
LVAPAMERFNGTPNTRFIVNLSGRPTLDGTVSVIDLPRRKLLGKIKTPRPRADDVVVFLDALQIQGTFEGGPRDRRPSSNASGFEAGTGACAVARTERRVDRAQLHSERRRHGPDCAELTAPLRYGGIAKDRHSRHARRDLFEQCRLKVLRKT